MGKFIDLTGQRFGRLVVIERAENYVSPRGIHQTRWICKCDCGKTTIKTTSRLADSARKKCCEQCSREKNLSGLRFGKLIVIADFGKKTENGIYWTCLCDCGTIVDVLSNSLVQGGTRSCGCGISNKSGFKKLPKGAASFNELYGQYERNARKKERIFNIDKNVFKKITQSNCFYCGSEPQAVWHSNKNGDYIYNGIDRVDSSKGYTEDNVVPCCGTCNVMKMALGKDEFLAHIERIYNHSIAPKKNEWHDVDEFYEDIK